jgi:hypothetical protein
MAFMTAMAWLLVSLDALMRARARGRFLAWLAAAVALTIAVCLIRSVGIALAAGGCCALLASAAHRRCSRHPAFTSYALAAMLIGAAAAMTVGAFVLRERWAATPLGAETYLNPLEDRSGAAILRNYGPWFALIVSDIGRVTVPFMFKCYGEIGAWWDVNMLVYVPACGLLLYGYLRWFRRGDDPLAWSMPFYLAVLTYFRYESGARWWVPMTPALFMCLWFALEPWSRRRNIFRAAWLLHVVAALAYWIRSDLPHTISVDRNWPTAHRLAEQITTGREQVVIDDSLADLGVLLTLALDRQIKEFSGNAPVQTPAEWMIIPAEKPPPPGFVPRSSVGGCMLLRRG